MGNDAKSIFNIIKTSSAITKAILSVMVISFVATFMPEVIYANPLMDNDLTRGAVQIATDILPVTGLIGGIGGVGAAAICLAMRTAGSEEDAPRHNKRIKGCLIGACVCGLIGGGSFLFDTLTHYTPIILP